MGMVINIIVVIAVVWCGIRGVQLEMKTHSGRLRYWPISLPLWATPIVLAFLFRSTLIPSLPDPFEWLNPVWWLFVVFALVGWLAGGLTLVSNLIEKVMSRK